MWNSRLQNMTITVDKIKHFLKNQKLGMEQIKPMHLLSEDEILDFLWFSKNSIVRRIVDAGSSLCTDDASKEMFHRLHIELNRVSFYRLHKTAIRSKIDDCWTNPMI